MNYKEFMALRGITSPEAPRRRGRKPKDKPVETKTRAELIKSAIESGFEEASLNSLSDDELMALPEQKE